MPLIRLFPVLFICAYLLPLKAQVPAIGAGTTLVYEIENKGKKFELQVTIKKLFPEVEITYNYILPSPKSGNLTIKAGALVQANKMYESFSGGNAVLTDRTVLWLSRELFEQVQYLVKRTETSEEEGIILILDAKDNEAFFDKVHPETIPLKIGSDTVSLPVIHLAEDRELFGDEDWAASMYVLNDPVNPLVVKLSVDYILTLKEIKLP